MTTETMRKRPYKRRKPYSLRTLEDRRPLLKPQYNGMRNRLGDFIRSCGNPVLWHETEKPSPGNPCAEADGLPFSFRKVEHMTVADLSCLGDFVG
jgi:hypothetical protein